MSDKEDLRSELINTIISYFPNVNAQDVGMSFDMILSKYHVEKTGTEITVYSKSKNEEMLNRFLISKAAAGRAERTVKHYREVNLRFFRHVGKDYDAVTADDIRLYLAVRTQRDRISKVTVKNEKLCVSSFYTWLQREEILLKNPMAKVDSPKTPKKKKKAFELMELEKIRGACRTNRERALIEVLCSTWCRISEVLNMKVDDIDTDKVIVHGKGDKYRTAYLNARAQLAVKEYLAERKDSNPYLFPRAKITGDIGTYGSGKDSYNWYQKPDLIAADGHTDIATAEAIVREIGRRAGVPKCHPHRFRRTGATHALRTGMPITTVQKILGHEDISTTQIYLDISDDEIKQAHEKYVI